MIEFDEEEPALKFERYLKTGSGREFTRAALSSGGMMVFPTLGVERARTISSGLTAQSKEIPRALSPPAKETSTAAACALLAPARC